MRCFLYPKEIHLMQNLDVWASESATGSTRQADTCCQVFTFKHKHLKMCFRGGCNSHTNICFSCAGSCCELLHLCLFCHWKDIIQSNLLCIYLNSVRTICIWINVILLSCYKYKPLHNCSQKGTNQWKCMYEIQIHSLIVGSMHVQVQQLIFKFSFFWEKNLKCIQVSHQIRNNPH